MEATHQQEAADVVQYEGPTPIVDPSQLQCRRTDMLTTPKIKQFTVTCPSIM